MATDPEIKALGKTLGCWPTPKSALTTLRRALPETHIITVQDGHMIGGDHDRVAVIAATADRVVIALNWAGLDQPLHDLALADLDACLVVDGFSYRGTSTLVLVPTDPSSPLVGMEMEERRARRLCKAVRPSIRKERRRRLAAHWSTKIPPGFSVTYSGRLLSDPKCSTEGPVDVVTAISEAGITLQWPEGASWQPTFIRWSSIEHLAVEGVEQYRNRPSVAAVVAFGVLGLAARRKETESYLVIDTTDGTWAIEVSDVLPTKLRADLSPVLRALPEGTEHREQPSPASDEEDVIDTIRRLGELRDEGLLTDGEFNEKKAELLGRL